MAQTRLNRDRETTMIGVDFLAHSSSCADPGMESILVIYEAFNPCRHPNVTGLLLDHGADLIAKEQQGLLPPSCISSRRRKWGLARLLSEGGEDA